MIQEACFGPGAEMNRHRGLRLSQLQVMSPSQFQRSNEASLVHSLLKAEREQCTSPDVNEKGSTLSTDAVSPWCWQPLVAVRR